MSRLPQLSLACSALLIAGIASANPETGDRTFTISGSGSSDQDLNTNTYGITAELGKFSSNAMQFGLRQSLAGVNRDHGDDSWSGSTRVFGDYHFGTGQWRPYLGLNIGGIYGDGVDDTFTAGPEAGLKYYVKDKTYVGFQAEYQFLFDSANEFGDNYDDGAFFYSLGVGFHF